MMPHEIPAQLRTYRRKRQLTQQEVATLMGISQASYSAWEAGMVHLPIHKLTALGKILGFDVTVDYTLSPKRATLRPTKQEVTP